MYKISYKIKMFKHKPTFNFYIRRLFKNKIFICIARIIITIYKKNDD